jgi:8-oxo-dGTP pyrophosphatase MutT (NUDIX family)
MSSKSNLTSKNPSDGIRFRACAICVRNVTTSDSRGDEILMVRLKDPTTSRILRTPPGGTIEPGESALQAALRESFEETGYLLKVISESGAANPVIARYEFPWDGRIHLCETAFFLCELVDLTAPPAPVEDADYNLGAQWLTMNELESVLHIELNIPKLRQGIVRSLAGLTGCNKTP